MKAGKGIAGLALESALWCRYCFGTTESGKTIEPNDPNWAKLQQVSTAAKENPDVWLAMHDIYGGVGQSPVFRKTFAEALNHVWRVGTVRALEDYLKT